MMMIFIVVLLLFGAKKLPELARGMGKAMGEFKKARDDFEREISHAVDRAEKEVNQVPTPAPATTQASHEAHSPENRNAHVS